MVAGVFGEVGDGGRAGHVGVGVADVAGVRSGP